MRAGSWPNRALTDNIVQMHAASPSIHREVSCGVIPFRRVEGRVQFLVVHSALVRNPDAAWEFPKGGLEVGETEVQAALRELREETTLTRVRLIPDFRDEVHYKFRRGGREIQKTVVFFTGEVDDWSEMPERPPTHEHALHPRLKQWHRWDVEVEIVHLLYHAGMRNLLGRASRFIHDHDRRAALDPRPLSVG